MTQTIYSALQSVAQKYPDHCAICYVDPADLDFDDADPIRVQYSQLLGDVTALANAFRALSGKNAPVVSLLLPSTNQALTALLAAQCAGIAHPVNFFLQAEDIATSLNDVGTDILVTIGSHPTLPIWQKAQALKAAIPTIQATVVIDRSQGQDGTHTLHQLIQQYPSDQLHGPVSGPSDIAAYYNTAGTTGKSKVVQLSHHNLLAAAGALGGAWGFEPDTRIVNALPFFHVAGANLLGLGPLLTGSEILLLSETGLRNPAILARHWDIVERYAPTIIGGIPSSLISLLDVPLKGADISSVKFCATGGAPMPATTAQTFETRFGLPIHAIYGMTETAGLIATRPIRTSLNYDRVGQPIENCAVEIRALDAGQPGATLPPSDPTEGLILVKGPQVFPGYLDPSQAHGSISADGYLITGDIGHMNEDQVLRISGRSKDVIIRSGHNIDPATIERCVTGFMGVAECAAVAMPDIVAGDVPALFVVPRKGNQINTAALQSHLRTNISEPQALPAKILVVESLPLTLVGKVSRLELRRIAAEQALNAALGAQDGQKPITVSIQKSGTLKAQVVADTSTHIKFPQASDIIAQFSLS